MEWRRWHMKSYQMDSIKSPKNKPEIITCTMDIKYKIWILFTIIYFLCFFFFSYFASFFSSPFIWWSNFLLFPTLHNSISASVWSFWAIAHSFFAIAHAVSALNSSICSCSSSMCSLGFWLLLLLSLLLFDSTSPTLDEFFTKRSLALCLDERVEMKFSISFGKNWCQFCTNF